MGIDQPMNGEIKTQLTWAEDMWSIMVQFRLLSSGFVEEAR